MDQRSDRKQPTTRAERAKARRRAQGRRNTAAWRRRKREEEASVVKPEPVVKDPIWADPDPEAPGQTVPGASGSPPAGTKYDPRIDVDADGNVTVADPGGDADQKPTEELKPSRYIRRAARVKAPKPPVPLADAVDPNTGRRRVVIRISDGRVIEGETRGGGGDGMPSATEILDWEN